MSVIVPVAIGVLGFCGNAALCVSYATTRRWGWATFCGLGALAGLLAAIMSVCAQ